MIDENEIKQLYYDMYTAMIEKNESELNRVHDDSFVLIHMTSMQQTKREYIHAIMNGTLNYYSSENDSLEISINGTVARLIGRNRVTAAVFGGGIHTWRLMLAFDLKKTDDGWKFTKAQASTY